MAMACKECEAALGAGAIEGGFEGALPVRADEGSAGHQSGGISKPEWRIRIERGELPDTMVIGPWPSYLQKGARLRAKTFDMREYYTEAAGRAANKAALDRAIARHTRVVFSKQATKSTRGEFRWETDYLISHGYRKAPGGWSIYYSR
jgi:hypothetical protein